jgi:hypothetical protein
MMQYRLGWVLSYALVTILALLFSNLSPVLSQDGLLEDTARQASRQFAQKLTTAIDQLAKGQGAEIGKVDIKVQGRPATAHLQHGIIQSSIENYLTEQNRFLKGSDEIAEISFTYSPSNGKQPSTLTIELIQLVNTTTNAKRGIPQERCKETQPVMDVSGAQLAINSFGNTSENLESFFGNRNNLKVVEQLTKPPSKKLRAEWKDEYLFAKDPRNETLDQKFGFRLEYESGEFIVPENQDGIPVHFIDANRPFLVGIKNNTASDFAFEVLIDGYPFLINRTPKEHKVHPYFVFGKEQKHNIGWIVFDPDKDKKFIERFLTLQDRPSSSSQDEGTIVARSNMDTSMAGSVTVCIYRVEKQTPKGNAKIWLGKPTGRKFDPIDDLQAVGYPKEPISQIVLKYEKKKQK